MGPAPCTRHHIKAMGLEAPLALIFSRWTVTGGNRPLQGLPPRTPPLTLVISLNPCLAVTSRPPGPLGPKAIGPKAHGARGP